MLLLVANSYRGGGHRKRPANRRAATPRVNPVVVQAICDLLGLAAPDRHQQAALRFGDIGHVEGDFSIGVAERASSASLSAICTEAPQRALHGLV